MKIQVILLLLAAGCAEEDAYHVQNLPSEVTVACAESAHTEVEADDLPFDLAAITARSGTRIATGEWADGGTTDVSVWLSARSDAAWQVTPVDTSCGGDARWEVDLTVTATSGDGHLTQAWSQRAAADGTTPWSLGVVLDATDAAALRAAAGYDATTDPYAALSLVWDTAVRGVIQTHADAADTGDVDVPVLEFE